MNFKKALTKRIENATCNTSTSASSIAIALIGGIAVGTLVSLLFAPQSGEDTRNMIASKSRDLKDSMKEQLKNLKSKMQDNAEDLADNAKEKLNTVKQSTNNAVKHSTTMGS
jgi:gas vesicle protein